MSRTRGCAIFLLGAASASAVWLTVIRFVVMDAVDVPVVTLNEWGSKPSWRVSGTSVVLVSEIFGVWEPGTASFAPGAVVPLLESREQILFYGVPDHRAPVTFMLDTGAQLNFMTLDVLDSLGVPPHVPAGGAWGGPTLLAATAPVGVELFVLDRLTIGDHVLHRQVFAAMPVKGFRNRFAGIGSQAFADVVLDLDLGARVLRINPVDPPPSPAPFALSLPVPSAFARFGDLVVPAVIDTGAGASVASPALAARLALAPGEEAGVTDATGVTRPVPAVRLPPFELAGAVLTAPRAGVAPLLPLEQAAGELWLLVGMDALDGHRVVIDYPAETVSITAGESVAGP